MANCKICTPGREASQHICNVCRNMNKIYCIGSSLKHTVQCTDKISGMTGDFVHAGNFEALTPVFDDLVALFTYLNKLGLTTNSNLEVFIKGV